MEVGWDSVVGIANRYGLNGTGIESRWGARFSAPVQTDPGAHPASYTMGIGSFPGVKRPGHGVDHPAPCSAEVKERVDLYLYRPSGPSWPPLGRTLLSCGAVVCSVVCHTCCLALSSERLKFEEWIFSENTILCYPSRAIIYANSSIEGYHNCGWELPKLCVEMLVDLTSVHLWYCFLVVFS
jgi:hypothetical protein